jgi:hypothetical protein
MVVVNLMYIANRDTQENRSREILRKDFWLCSDEFTIRTVFLTTYFVESM